MKMKHRLIIESNGVFCSLPLKIISNFCMIFTFYKNSILFKAIQKGDIMNGLSGVHM